MNMVPPAESNPLSDLPQSRDAWYCTARKLRLWILDDDRIPYRPYVMLARHLRTHLHFPFEANYLGFSAIDGVRPGSKVRVTGIAEIDDLYGLLVDVRAGRKQAVLPLVDLEVAGEQSGDNHDRIEEYGTWFANR